MQYVKAMQYAFGILIFFFFYPQYIITGNINISMSVCMQRNFILHVNGLHFIV